MDRNGERRMGSDRRRRAEVYFPWQEPDWVADRDADWDGIERRSADRRAGSDRRHPICRGDQPSCYSDDWARARGARNICEWLDRCARQPTIGLPRDWTPAA